MKHYHPINKQLIDELNCEISRDWNSGNLLIESSKASHIIVRLLNLESYELKNAKGLAIHLHLSQIFIGDEEELEGYFF